MAPLHLRIDRSRADLRLCAPERGNALDRALVEHLRDTLRQLMQEPSWRVLVIRAEGPSFCRGLDLEQEFQNEPGEAVVTAGILADCLSLLAESPRPVLAVVEGEVLGGGLGLVAACDLVLASEGATFAATEALVGMIPAIISPFLARRVGYARLRYLALSTRVLEAREAERMGLVDQVLPLPGLEEGVRRQLQRLLRSAPAALSEIKKYTSILQSLEDQGASGELGVQVTLARETLKAWLGREEVVEGIREFVSGGTPPWWERK